MPDDRDSHLTASPLDGSLSSPLAAKSDAIAAIPSPEPQDADSVKKHIHDAVADFDFEKAEAEISKLPEPVRQDGPLRYLQARIALRLGRPSEATQRLLNLEAALPLLGPSIAAMRVDATISEKRIANDLGAAAMTLATKGDPRSLYQAMLWFEQSDRKDDALRTASRVLRLSKKRAKEESLARSLRLRWLSEAETQEDTRWLFAHGETHEGYEKESVLAVARMTKSATAEAWRERANHLAESGKTELALEAAGHSATRGPRLSCIRGDIFYKTRKHYADAATAFRSCAHDPGPNRAEYTLMAARALSRGEQDDAAQKLYAEVVSLFPRTPAAEEAAYLSGRLSALHGNWKEAANALDQATLRFPLSKNAHERSRYRAIAHLMAKDLRVARKIFEVESADQDPEESARAANMAALAAWEDGEHLWAIGRWAEVARQHPLTYAALVANARLVWAHTAEIPAFANKPVASSTMGAMGVDRTSLAPVPLPITLPAPIDVLHSLGLEDEAEELLRKREGELAKDTRMAARLAELSCDAYGVLDRGERRHELARQAPQNLLAVPPATESSWAWHCVYPEPYGRVVQQASQENAISPLLVYSIMRSESGFRPEVLSPVGAVGLLQLMPETAKQTARTGELGPDTTLSLQNARTNIILGARVAGALRTKFVSLPLVAGAYNAGPEAITRWRKRLAQVPLDVFAELIPYAETRVYIARVMGNLAHLEYLHGGDSSVSKLSLELPPVAGP
jgi:soluble lytic murein transglycosylase